MRPNVYDGPNIIVRSISKVGLIFQHYIFIDYSRDFINLVVFRIINVLLHTTNLIIQFHIRFTSECYVIVVIHIPLHLMKIRVLVLRANLKHSKIKPLSMNSLPGEFLST